MLNTVEPRRRTLARALLLATLALAAPVVSPAPAIAQDQGKADFEKGAKLYKAQEYEAALPFFERAYEASGRRPSTIIALAQCERALKRYDDALKHLREYLTTRPPKDKARVAEETIELIQDLQAAAATTSASEASPDETPAIGAAPVPAKPPVDAGATPPIGSTPAPTPRSTPSGSTHPASQEGAIPPPPTPVVPYRPEPQPSTRASPAPHAEMPVVPHVRRGPGALPWLVTGGGAAVAVAGAVMLGVGRSDVGKVEDAADGTPYRGDIADAADRAPVMTGVGGALLGVGLAAAGAGITWFFLSRGDERSVELAADERGSR